MGVTIHGSSDSDDLILVEGDIEEGFNVNTGPHDADVLLAFSDGTVLRVRYSESGVWRMSVVCHSGVGNNIDIISAVEGEVDNYSDRVTLSGRVEWVVLGVDMATSVQPVVTK